jgi:hypothetical protein
MQTTTKLNSAAAAALFQEVMKHLKEKLFSVIFFQEIKMRR